MLDPLHAYIFLPIVEMLQCDPRKASLACANAFLPSVLTLSAVRIATLDAATRPSPYGFQTMHVVGSCDTPGPRRRTPRMRLVST